MKWDTKSFAWRFGLRFDNGDGDGDGTAAAAAAAGYGMGSGMGTGGAPAGTSTSVGWGGGYGGTTAGDTGGGGQTSVGYGSVGAGNTGTATGYGATAYGGGAAARGGVSGGGTTGTGGGGAATGGGGGTATGGSASGPGGAGYGGGSGAATNPVSLENRLKSMLSYQLAGAYGSDPATVNMLREAALMGVPPGYATGVATATHPISVSALGPPSTGPSGNVALTPGNEGAAGYNAMTQFVNSLRNAYSENFPGGTANMGAPAAGVAAVPTAGLANMGFPAYGVEGNIGMGVPGYASALKAPPGSSVGQASITGPAYAMNPNVPSQFASNMMGFAPRSPSYGTTGFSNQMAANVMGNPDVSINTGRYGTGASSVQAANSQGSGSAQYGNNQLQGRIWH